jgi:hypothetical protein
MPTIAVHQAGHAVRVSQPRIFRHSRRFRGLQMRKLRNAGIAHRLAPRVMYRIQERPMKSKLLVSTVVAASLLAPAVAFAQTSAPPDSTGPSAAQSDLKTHHAMKSTHMKPGTTTGMSSSTNRTRVGGESVARKPAD